MRVLFVNENLGGHATVHHNLERALTSHPEIQAEFLHVPPPGIARRIVGASVPWLGRLDLDLQPIRAQLALSWHVRRALRRKRDAFDVLHVYTQNAALLSVGTLRRHPSVISTDATNALNAYRMPHRRPTRWTAKLLPISRAADRRAFKAATLVIPNSEYVARSLRSTYAIPESRIRVLPMGIEVPAVERGPASKLPTLTFVGRQLEPKGGRRLMRLYREHLADQCTLEIVTKDHVDPTPGIRVHNDIGVGDPRLLEILGRTDLFVFPSVMDQSPNAVLEAMAMGIPVVALAVGAVPEMVQDGVSGLIVSPGDDPALLHAIRTIIDDAGLRSRMGAAARARVVEHYDMNRTVTELVTILEEAQQSFAKGSPT